METKPLVSICMITYGHEKFIEQAINGVLMQQCNFEIELIISNDCSPDATNTLIETILKTHPKANCINYINHTTNIGMMPNFIFALKKCTGKYIALCEGDDYWTDPLKLQKQFDFLEANEDYVICFHKVLFQMPSNELVEDFLTIVPNEYENLKNLAENGNYIHTPSVFYRNCLTNYPNEFAISPIGDYFLYTMLANFGKLKYLKEQMAVYRYGVGFYSGFDGSIKSKKWIKTLLLIVSSSNNELINEILINKIIKSFKLDEFEVNSKITKLSKIKNFTIQFVPPIFFTLKNKIFKK